MMIENAMAVAKSKNFTKRIEDVIGDLQNIVVVAMESVIFSAEAHAEDDDREGNGLPTPPKVEDSIDEADHLTEMSVDDLIAESYTYGKTDEEISREFIDDLKTQIGSYAWLFVAIGIALDNEDKKDMVKILSNKMLELKAKSNPEQGAQNVNGN